MLVAWLARNVRAQSIYLCMNLLGSLLTSSASTHKYFHLGPKRAKHPLLVGGWLSCGLSDVNFTYRPS